MNGIFFRKVDALVQGTGKATAFRGMIHGRGTNSANNVGLWLHDETPRLVARKGSPAAGGGKWAKFDSLVMPDHAGMIFTGHVTADSNELGPRRRHGLWRMNPEGELELLLRTGDILNVGGVGREVRTFKALTSQAGSLGAAHGHDEAGRVAVVVTFADRSVALVRFGTP